MKRRGRTTERHGETILAGGAHLRDATGAETRVEALLRAGFPEEPVPAALEEAQLAVIVEAAGSAMTHGTATEAPRSPARRRRPFRMPRLAAGLAAASAAFLLLFSGLAGAGTLPSPLQGFASRAAALIGVHVPRPHGSSPEGLTTPSVSATPSARASADANHGVGADGHPRSAPTSKGQRRRAGTHSQVPGGQGEHRTHRGKPAAPAPSSSKGGPRPSSGADRGQRISRLVGSWGVASSPRRGSTKRSLPPKRDGSSK